MARLTGIATTYKPDGTVAVDLGLDYNSSNGWATAVVCQNNTTASVQASAVFSGGTYSEAFPPGENLRTLPNRKVQVVLDTEGVSIPGLNSVSVSG